MPRFSSNDMVHNHYLEEAKKKKQEMDRNSESSVLHSTRLQNTTNDHKPKPRSNNQIPRSLPVSKSIFVTITVLPKANHSKSSSSFLDYKHFVCSTCHKCVFNANHDVCITKFLKEVNSRAKIQSNKTRNVNKPVEQKIHTQKPVRQIFTGHRFSPNKTSTMYEKTSPRSNLRWKPTGRIFKTIGLRWIPTGKILASCTSLTGQQKQRINFSAGTSFNVKQENLRLSMEHGFLSSGGKQKKGNTPGNVCGSANQHEKVDHTLDGSTASHGTNGPNDVQTESDKPVITTNSKGPVLFDKLLTGEPSRKSINFCTLHWPTGNEADVDVSLDSNDGMDAMLKNGPFFIRNNRFILKKWNPDVNLLKEDIGNVPVWVRFHGVPMTALSEDGLSVISTKLNTPLMLNSYTFDMCMQSLGMSSYVRAMIEL
ncbi:hypothetical protein Tco_0355806 [Tanacetum coccineum]